MRRAVILMFLVLFLQSGSASDEKDDDVPAGNSKEGEKDADGDADGGKPDPGGVAWQNIKFMWGEITGFYTKAITKIKSVLGIPDATTEKSDEAAPGEATDATDAADAPEK